MINNKFISYFQENLSRSKPAMDYLTERGFRPQLIKAMKIGYAPGVILSTSDEAFIDEARAAKLICHSPEGSEYDFFRRRIVFPISVLNNTVYMAGRNINGSDPKYINIPAPNPFFINEGVLMHNPQYVVVTEGFIDCYTLLQCGIPSVGIAGCTRTKAEQLKKLLPIKTVYIMFDNDANGAGQEGSRKTAFELCKLGHTDVRVCFIPRKGPYPKMDINLVYSLLKFNDPMFVETITEVMRQGQVFNNSEVYFKKMLGAMASKGIPPTTSLSQLEQLDLFQKYLDLLDQGDIWRCSCPFHAESRPSFTIWKKDKAVYTALCFSCGWSGDAQELENELKEKGLVKDE